jgi:hypothetical protein
MLRWDEDKTLMVNVVIVIHRELAQPTLDECIGDIWRKLTLKAISQHYRKVSQLFLWCSSSEVLSAEISEIFQPTILGPLGIGIISGIIIRFDAIGQKDQGMRRRAIGG